ncbi:MAG: peptide ABC transporter substrate-binding protein [Anaerolineae bacterium]
MSRKTILIAGLVLVALLVVVVSCAAVGVGGYLLFQNKPGPTQPVTERQPAAERDLATEEDSTPAAVGTLRIAGAEPLTLDPAMVQDSTSAEYVVHLFSGLVTLDREMEIQPDLAASWDLSGDGRIYTFHLVEDATFQDGRPIAAEDVVYSLERACSPALGSPVAGSYLNDIVGASAFMAGEADSISGLAAVDEHTLRIEIDAPKAYFLAKLTYPTAYVVDSEQIAQDGDTWWRQPNGSGPFVLESWESDRIVLSANPRYYGGRVSLGRAEFYFGGGLPITMYENGLLDIVAVDSTEIERVLDPSNPLYAEHHVSSELSVQYLGLNVNAAPFDDVLVRQAFAHAIDKAKLAELVLKGTASAADSILPPTMPDFDPTFAGLEYDPAKAKELLAGSRYGAEGAMPPVVLSISGTSGYMDSVTQAIVGMLEENLGIQVTVEQIDWGYFLRDVSLGRYQIALSGWIADYPDSQNFLDLQFHSASSQNDTGYSNPEVDALLERARTETDEAQRTDLYRQAEQRIVDEAPWIPLTHGITYTLVKPHIVGYVGSETMYPWLRDIVLEP